MSVKEFREPILRLSPTHNLYHSSFLLAAFGELGSTGARTSILIDSAVSPFVPRIDLGERHYAFDLFDSSALFDYDALENCTVYYKRSYYVPDLPSNYAQRIMPFGLNYACRSSTGDRLLMRLSCRCTPLKLLHFTGLRTYVGLPRSDRYEFAPTSNPQPVVWFQSRVWPTEEMDEESRQIDLNGCRVQLVLALRRHFGRRFRGGIIPSTLAIREYPPEALSYEPHSRAQYVKRARTPLIAIYSRGLHNSHAFKLAEYLAASKCIVGEPLRNRVPHPLWEDLNYCSFRTIDECIAKCELLLTNAAHAREMRLANWKYYQHYVHYSRRLADLFQIARAIERPNEAE